jgi:SAM-dependent methyltransferase
MTFFCRVCMCERRGAEHLFREMMFGTREEFAYLECEICGCIQIKNVPDLSKYYPPDYLSLDESRGVLLASKWKYRLGAKFAGRFLFEKDAIGKFVLDRKPWIAEHFPLSLLDPAIDLKPDMKILDFGCGRGHLLRTLQTFGFRDLTGLDAFIDEDLDLGRGLKIFKGSLGRLDATFDLIMMHHSFEHLIDPAETLSHSKRLLAHGGTLLIRMPIVNKAWESYRENWVQLDPPRHLILYTERGFRKFAEECGFEIEKVVYDSTAFQFWGSEQYRKDIPLKDPRSHDIFENPESVFSAEQIGVWETEAMKLNREGLGDQACFYLRLN